MENDDTLNSKNLYEHYIWGDLKLGDLRSFLWDKEDLEFFNALNKLIGDISTKYDYL